MRSAFFLSLLVLFALASSSEKSLAAQCPADAFKASMAVWPFGALGYKETQTKMHPCGRRITCVGGNFHESKILRKCRWE